MPVVTFLVLFLVSLVVFVGLQATTQPPSDTKVIEFSIEGERQSIPTRAKTVGEFLDRAAIELGPNDIVEPAADTEIYSNKFHVNVYRARPVTIVEEGDRRIFAYSAATTPRSIAEQAGLKIYAEDKLESDLPNNFLKEGVLGEKIVITRSIPANINLYGQHVPVRTHAKTVGDLLAEKNVQLAENDSVRPSLDRPIASNMQIFVIRSGTQLATVEEEIPMPLEVIEDKSLSFGSQAIRQAGSPGKRIVTYQITLQNGKEVGRKKIQEIIATQPVKQIVARGPQGSFGQALAMLRQCEAGGNYGINTGNGYYGAYQFHAGTWRGVAPAPYNNRLPHEAPAHIQDMAATTLYKGRGWQPWPGCTSKLGLQDIYR